MLKRVWLYVDVQPSGRYAVLPVIERVASELRPSNVPGSSDASLVLPPRSSETSFVVKLNTPAGSEVRPGFS